MFYDEEAKKFINSFSKLINSDFYINKRKINELFDNNNLELDNINPELKEFCIKIYNDGYSIVAKHNEYFLNKKLVEYKDYFDNLFKEIDPSILLDEEQRRAILIDEDYSLIIAGAGSGKTTTMAAKVKYLVDKLNVKPEKIVLLAFTTKAKEELENRINNDFKLNVEVLTFHKLGFRFLKQIFKRPISTANTYTLNQAIVEYVKTIVFPNNNKMVEFLTYFKDYLYFDETVLNYDNFDVYFKDYADNLYLKNYENIKAFNQKRIESRYESFRTIKGEFLKSIGEVKIANYLYMNGYDYIYENKYPYKINDTTSYSPDFTVLDNGKNYYIEYYGMTKYLNNGKFSEEEVEAYNKLIEKKRQLHAKYKTDLIELYYEYQDNSNCIDKLEEILKQKNSCTVKKTDEEIFYKLLYTNQESQFFKFVNLVTIFINRFKEKGYVLEDFDLLIDNASNELLKHQLEFVKPIYKFYEKKIHGDYVVDFNDMINYGYKYMENYKVDASWVDYDYLIIDEYQDISMQRYNFAKKLSDLFHAKITAVGDDWQSIFSFTGSEVELFTKFYDLMGYAEISKITKTYRNSQELIDIAGTFVSKNEEQFKKELSSIKHLKNPIEIINCDVFSSEAMSEAVNNILSKIKDEKPNGTVLLLGRFNNDIDILLSSSKFIKGPNDRIISNLCKGLKIDFLSVHSSKGLGYDNVILLNSLNDKKGFPSKIKDEPLIQVLNPEIHESIEYPEERRLFYVALTRTKNKLYILTPKEPYSKRSEFVREIVDNENVRITDFNNII